MIQTSSAQAREERLPSRYEIGACNSRARVWTAESEPVLKSPLRLFPEMTPRIWFKVVTDRSNKFKQTFES